MTDKAVLVIGGGSWGATLATVIAEKGRSVRLWEFDKAIAERLATQRTLKVLPDLKLQPAIEVTSYLEAALKGMTTIVSAIPSQFVRSTWRAAKATGALEASARIISVSKGLELESLKRMDQVIEEEAGIGDDHFAVLGGPSHAEEVCRRLPTAVVAASKNPEMVQLAKDLFSIDSLRVYGVADVVGVELGAALKNVFAIACGISDGLGFGDNTRAAIMTRGLNEMVRIGTQMGADILTFFGLAGMGDLVVTCMSEHSRNHTLGFKIGKGLNVPQALAEMTMVAEGYKTSPSAYALVERFSLPCPLTREIYEVLYKGKDPRASLRDLMGRESRNEWKGIALPTP